MIVPPERLGSPGRCFLHGRRLTMKLVQGFPANLHGLECGGLRANRARKRFSAQSHFNSGRIQRGRFALAGFLPRCAASGICISIAWFVTETIASAFLGWISAALLIYGVRVAADLSPAYCCGLVVHAVGFYWIYGTIADFGGFGLVVSGLIFALYVGFRGDPILGIRLRPSQPRTKLRSYCLRSPIAIVVSELVTIRVFHWHLGILRSLSRRSSRSPALAERCWFHLSCSGWPRPACGYRFSRVATGLPSAGGWTGALARLWRFDDRRLRVQPWGKTRSRTRSGPTVTCGEARSRLDLEKPRPTARSQPRDSPQGGSHRLARGLDSCVYSGRSGLGSQTA